MEEQKKTGSSPLVWIAGVVALVAVVAAAVLIFRGPAEQTTNNAERPAPAAPSTEKVEPAHPDGGVTSDMRGRRVLVPANDRGTPRTDAVYAAEDQCSPAEKIRTPEGLEIQRAHGMATVWSTSDGPTGFTGPLPDGYSRTPAGAALAAWNLYALMNAGGDAATAVLTERSGMSQSQRSEFLRILEENGSAASMEARENWENVTVPDGFRVLSCADDLVNIELAKPLGADVQGPSDKYWQVLRLPMLWKGDRWEINGADGNNVERETINELGSEWSRWEF